MSKKEFEKCKSDSLFTRDVIFMTNYITFLKTKILPKYRLQRAQLIFSKELQTNLNILKQLYDSTLQAKLAVFESDMDKNQYYVQPKAYIGSLLAFQVFKFYPDVYAILLNPIHLDLKPKTKKKDLNLYTRLFDQTTNLITPDLHKKIRPLVTSLGREKGTYQETIVPQLFKGSVQEGYSMQCNVINFLLWCSSE